METKNAKFTGSIERRLNYEGGIYIYGKNKIKEQGVDIGGWNHTGDSPDCDISSSF